MKKQTKTQLELTLENMTLHNQSKLLKAIVKYYGLHLESFVWNNINEMEKKK